MMSLDFHGWEVYYEHDHHLNANQDPQKGTFYTMYHGTTVGKAKSIIKDGFQPSKDGMLGPGVYISRDMKKAQRYPLRAAANDKVVLILNVDLGKVKRIDQDNHPMQKTWHSQGYDTAWVPPNCGMKAVPSGLEEDCVWDPKRIQTIDVHASDKSIQDNLRSMFGQNASSCVVCKKKSNVIHHTQPCWKCRNMICPLMTKHVCKLES